MSVIISVNLSYIQSPKRFDAKCNQWITQWIINRSGAHLFKHDKNPLYLLVSDAAPSVAHDIILYNGMFFNPSIFVPP